MSSFALCRQGSQARASSTSTHRRPESFDGFISMGREADLAHLADPGAKTGTLASDIVAAWYSGNYQTATGLASIGLPNALLWDAVDFTKPPGSSGGRLGFWADAPYG